MFDELFVDPPLARSIGDLQDIVRVLKAKGASLKATEQPIDTTSAAGKAFLDMLGAFAGVRDESTIGASEIAKALKIGRASVYRALTSVP